MSRDKTKKMTFWGASPIIFLITIIFSVPIIVLNYYLKSTFEINILSYNIIRILTIVLILPGIPLYIYSVKKLKIAFNKKMSITNGIFSLCRNPLFAVVIYLILPGIILFFSSWLLLSIPVFFYVVFKMYINREEKLLEDAFGQEYIEYKKNTLAIFPIPWKYKKA